MARIFSGISLFNYFPYMEKKICGHYMKQRILRVITVETSFPIIISLLVLHWPPNDPTCLENEMGQLFMQSCC